MAKNENVSVPAIGEFSPGLSQSRLTPAPRSHARESDRERRRSAATIRLIFPHYWTVNSQRIF